MLKLTLAEWLEVPNLFLFSLCEIVLHKAPSSQRNAYRLKAFIELSLVFLCFNLETAAILTYVASYLFTKTFVVH